MKKRYHRKVTCMILFVLLTGLGVFFLGPVLAIAGFLGLFLTLFLYKTDKKVNHHSNQNIILNDEGGMLRTIDLLDGNKYVITEKSSLLGGNINKREYRYKLEGDSIYFKLVNLELGGIFDVKDNVILKSEIKNRIEEKKKNSGGLYFGKSYEETVEDLKNKISWHTEDSYSSYGIRYVLYKVIYGYAKEDLNTYFRKILEEKKLIDFELSKILSKYNAKFEYSEDGLLEIKALETLNDTSKDKVILEIEALVKLNGIKDIYDLKYSIKEAKKYIEG